MFYKWSAKAQEKKDECELDSSWVYACENEKIRNQPEFEVLGDVLSGS